MDCGRIAELLAPFLDPAAPLAADSLNRISTYINLLQRWNTRLNLTAIRDPDEIVARHFGESFFAARNLFLRDAGPVRLADVGSGAGFPGIPIKLFAPALHVTLIESNHKKATFLREVARTLTLTDIDIQNTRAETLPEHSFDVVTLRAVERFETILPFASRLVAPNGRLALLVGNSQTDIIQRLLPNASIRPGVPVPHSKSRVLVVAQRGASTK